MRLTYKAQDQYGKETGTVWYASTVGDSIFPKSDREEQVLKKLAAYEDAEEQGRLVILPCKVGDTLYAPTRRIVSEFVITKFEYGGIDSYGHGLWVCWHLANGISGELRLDGIDARYIGKRVFLTRAEAEAALKGESKDV